MATRFSFELRDENGAVIPMEEAVEGRNAEVYEFDFGVEVSVDKATSKVTGIREYRPLKVIKPIDKSSPIIFQKLCEGKKLKLAEIVLYRNDPNEGDEKAFYKYLLEDVSIVEQAPIVPNTTQASTKYLPPLEAIKLVAEKVTMQFIDGNIEYSDEYRKKAIG